MLTAIELLKSAGKELKRILSIYYG